jgi:hypothetical protein
MTREEILLLKEILQKLDSLQRSQAYAALDNDIRESNHFKDLIDDYRAQIYTSIVEDFLSAFEACEFHSDELLFALADAFKKRGQCKVVECLNNAAQVVSIHNTGDNR